MTFINLVPPIYYNVKQYGAVGDGVTDDTTAIANARSAANAAGGGTVYYPTGIFISGNQTLYSFVTDLGAGIGATTIKLKNGANTDLFSAQTSLINLSAAFGSGIDRGKPGHVLDEKPDPGRKQSQSVKRPILSSALLRLYLRVA